MPAKIKMHQYVIFIKSLNFDTADISVYVQKTSYFSFMYMLDLYF